MNLSGYKIIYTAPEWQAMRTRGIGASEVAAALGLSKWDSPLSLWGRKTGRIEPKQATFSMELGHAAEPVIAKFYERQTGRKLYDLGDFTTYQHIEHDFLFCTPDRITEDEQGRPGAVEMKNPRRIPAGEWKDEAPLMYQAQLQIQLEILGLEWGELVAPVGEELRIFRYEYSPAFISWALPKLQYFWDCVQNDEPPQVDGLDATAKAIAAMHPDDNGETIDLPEDLHNAAEELERIKGEINRLETDKRYQENRIKAAIGNNTFGLAGAVKWSYKTQTRKGVLKVDPSQAAALTEAGIDFEETEETTFRVLRKGKA